MSWGKSNCPPCHNGCTSISLRRHQRGKNSSSVPFIFAFCLTIALKKYYPDNTGTQLRKIHPRLIKITGMPSSGLPFIFIPYICLILVNKCKKWTWYSYSIGRSDMGCSICNIMQYELKFVANRQNYGQSNVPKMQSAHIQVHGLNFRSWCVVPLIFVFKHRMMYGWMHSYPHHIILHYPQFFDTRSIKSNLLHNKPEILPLKWTDYLVSILHPVAIAEGNLLMQ